MYYLKYFYSCLKYLVWPLKRPVPFADHIEMLHYKEGPFEDPEERAWRTYRHNWTLPNESYRASHYDEIPSYLPIYYEEM